MAAIPERFRSPDVRLLPAWRRAAWFRMRHYPFVFASRAITLLAVCLVASSALAQPPDPSPDQPPLSLEQLMRSEIRTVFGASRFLQRVVDAPASVSIVTAEEIERFGYRTLADVLRGVRGLYVSSDRNYSYLGIRGSSRPGDYNTRVLLLVDGHRLNDNVYDQAAIGTEFPLDVDLIERVEIVRGPSSTLYGTNAFFAVINVVTRQGGSLPAVSGSADAGSLGTWRGRVTLARTLRGGGDVLLSATGYTSDGERHLVLEGADGRRVVAHPDLDRDDAGQLFGSARVGAWTAQALLGIRTKGIPTGAYGTRLDDRGTFTRDTRAYVNLQRLGEWHGASIRARGGFDLYHYDGDYVEDEGVSVDTGRGQWWSGELSGVRRVGGAHLATAGIELRGNVRQDQSYLAAGDTHLSVDDRRRSFVWSLFAQDEITIGPRLVVNGSVGYDRYPSFGGAATWRGAAIYKPSPNRAWKAVAGTAFRAPNAYELYYYDAPGHRSHLEPERVRTLELAWDEYLVPGVRISGSLFRNRVRDIISLVPEPEHPLGLHFENVDHLRATGIGVEVEAVLGGGTQALASYSIGRVEEAGRARPLNSPRHVAIGRLMAPVARGALSLGAEVRYLSERLANGSVPIPGAAITRVTLTSRELAGRIVVAGTIDNLFGVRHADPGAPEHPYAAIPRDGRTGLVRVKWRF
jgi:outer membrane receptor for ferrienterochelin and colicins